MGIECNRWNIVGMNGRALHCVCMSESSGRGDVGNGIRGNTFGRAGRAT